jgi:hypothetical protein
MGLSIQDYLKKINSQLTFIDILSLFITCVFLIILAGYIFHIQQKSTEPLVYREGAYENSLKVGEKSSLDPSKPFGSSKGKTYTFSWCQGASRISEKNKVYFGSEEEAKQSGRTLSKLCSK